MDNMNDTSGSLGGCDWVRQSLPGADIDHPHYISLYLLDQWLSGTAIAAAQGVMLDFGCGGQPYKSRFMPHIKQYIGADIASANTIAPDILIIPGKALPLPNASIDTLLSTQTLEHVFDTHAYIGECARLVRPCGALILTAPMQWRQHEVPNDYFRFTKYGISSLLHQHGFEVQSMTACGGAYAVLGQMFLSHLHERGIQRRGINKFINRLSLWLDRKYPDSEETLNWMCVATRTPEIVEQDCGVPHV